MQKTDAEALKENDAHEKDFGLAYVTWFHNGTLERGLVLREYRTIARGGRVTALAGHGVGS